MPIYEYRCGACGHELEALQKLSEAPLVACPSCHANSLVKQVSAAGFQLKGSGWYATDFKGGGKKKEILKKVELAEKRERLVNHADLPGLLRHVHNACGSNAGKRHQDRGNALRIIINVQAHKHSLEGASRTEPAPRAAFCLHTLDQHWAVRRQRQSFGRGAEQGCQAVVIPGDIFDLRCPVFCLRTTDGSTVWSEGEKFVATEGSTPLIVGDTLYISSNGRESVLVAVDKMTGRLLWKVPEPVDAGGPEAVFGAGSSPTYQVVNGIPQIITSVYRNDNMGVHALTGEILWHWKLPTPVSSGLVSTPVAIGSRVFFSAFQGDSSHGIWLDMKTKDGRIEPVVRFQSTRLQCNAYHTVSVVDGAVYGFGIGTEHEALQCTDMETGALLWEQADPDWSRRGNLVAGDEPHLAIAGRDRRVDPGPDHRGAGAPGDVKDGQVLGASHVKPASADRAHRASHRRQS